MLLSLAWKNIWRNKLRTLVLVSAIAFGIAGVIFFIGLSQGFMDARNKKLIDTQLSHIQIHNPQFESVFSLKDTISDIAQVESFLSKRKFVKGFSCRLKTLAMATSPYNSAGVMVVGINPIDEIKVTRLYSYMADSASKYLDRVKRQNSIIIGHALARRLQLISYRLTDRVLAELKDLGLPQSVVDSLAQLKDKPFRLSSTFYDKLEEVLPQDDYNKYADAIAQHAAHYRLHRRIILRMQDINGQVVEAAFVVVGVFYTQNDLFDGQFVFVKKPYLAQLLGLPGNTTNEVAIRVDNPDKVVEYQQVLKKRFPELSVKNMYELDPILRISRTLVYLYYAIVEIFVFLALSFGIINIMLMAVLERTKELGMLKAIGMNRRRIFVMIFNETLLITFLGAIIGLFVGWLIIVITSHTGLDFTRFARRGFESLGFSAVVYPRIPLLAMLEVVVFVVITAFLSSLYPTIRALKLKPAEALRYEL